jgi:hypothetical protein
MCSSQKSAPIFLFLASLAICLMLTLERAGFQVQLSEERTKRANEVPQIKIRARNASILKASILKCPLRTSGYMCGACLWLW